jgi:hypothetical protein
MSTTADVGARHLRIPLLLFAWKKLLPGGDVFLVLETVEFDKLVDRCAVFLRNPLQGVPGPDLVILATAFAFATALGRGSGGSPADAR